MSEIKGQLLGIVLTIAIFGVVLTAMTLTFQKVSKSVEDQANSAIAQGNASIAENSTSSRVYSLTY